MISRYDPLQARSKIRKNAHEHLEEAQGRVTAVSSHYFGSFAPSILLSHSLSSIDHLASGGTSPSIWLCSQAERPLKDRWMDEGVGKKKEMEK